MSSLDGTVQDNSATNTNSVQPVSWVYDNGIGAGPLAEANGNPTRAGGKPAVNSAGVLGCDASRKAQVTTVRPAGGELGRGFRV